MNKAAVAHNFTVYMFRLIFKRVPVWIGRGMLKTLIWGAFVLFSIVIEVWSALLIAREQLRRTSLWQRIFYR